MEDYCGDYVFFFRASKENSAKKSDVFFFCFLFYVSEEDICLTYATTLRARYLILRFSGTKHGSLPGTKKRPGEGEGKKQEH